MANPLRTNPEICVERETIRAFQRTSQAAVMDIERINQIGNTLSDLAARTEALRGYL